MCHTSSWDAIGASGDDGIVDGGGNGGPSWYGQPQDNYINYIQLHLISNLHNFWVQHGQPYP